MIFFNREEGGRKLAQLLLQRKFDDPIVIGLPRGGVITASEVASLLTCPLEVAIVRKIGSPIDPEYGIGAMSEDEECFFSSGADFFDLESEEVKETIEEERIELRRRIAKYRGHVLKLPEGKTFLVIDDGLATGVSATAAIKFLKKFKPKKIIFAAPVGPRQIKSYLREICDEIILVERPENFLGVGNWYQEFKQTTDEEVLERITHKKR